MGGVAIATVTLYPLGLLYYNHFGIYEARVDESFSWYTILLINIENKTKTAASVYELFGQSSYT